MRERKNTLQRAVNLLVFCLLVFVGTELKAQDPFILAVEGEIRSQNERGALENATIKIKKDGASWNNATTNSKGIFTIDLPPHSKYLMEITAPGYVTKRLSINLKNLPPEVLAEVPPPFEFEMALFKEVDGLDVSILDKPMAELAYNPAIMGLGYDEEYTKSVKARIEQLQEDLEALEKEYDSEMSDGQKAMSKGDYSIAKAHFAAALKAKPGDEDAQKKLEDAQEKYAAAQAEKEKEKAYETAIENAELALHEGNLKEAEAEFMKAFDAKPGDVYARDQIKEVRDMIAASAKAEQTYITAIAKADAALAVNDYLTAKAEYTKASEAKPEDKYAKDQLTHVEELLVADAKKQTEYIQAIERAETAMDNKDYEAAKAAFEQASTVKPEESYPKEQIAELTALLAEIALKAKAYDQAIKKADALFAEAKFADAKTAYEEAIDINPNQQYPKDKVAEINEKLKALEESEKQYAALIKDADARYESKDYIAAKSEYTKALEIKPNEVHPKSRIDEIAGILEREAKLEEDYKYAISNADNAFKAKDYQSAKMEYEAASKLKPDEAYPQEQLVKVNEFLAQMAAAEENYNKALADGDAKFKAEDYEGAKANYKQAATIKPEEQYPKDQLAAIDAKLVEIANMNQKYDETIAKADEQYKAGSLEEAKATYQSALDLKPTETYPKEQIAAITAAIAEAQKQDEQYQSLVATGDKEFEAANYGAALTAFKSAGELKPEESYPKEKIAEIEQKQSELAKVEEEYKAVIAKADESFNAGELEAALPLYQEAAGIKEGNPYPIEQITLIETKLKERKEKEANYEKAIADAEAKEKAGELAAALEGFKNASTIKPEEEYPKQKIEALTAAIAENEKIDAQYAEAIALADEAKKGEEYDIALTQYNKAAEIKPDEQYPKDQIKEVEALKAAALEAIALAQKKDDEYNAAIGEADKLLADQKYEDAKIKYQEALDIKPTEEYPKTKISEIDAAVAGLMAEKEKDEKYGAAIAAADDAFNSKEWETAKTKYKEAQSVKPEESYPADQLVAIETAIAEAAALASQQAKDEQYAAAIAAADAAFEAKEWETAKSKYNEAKTVKPEESYPGEQLKAIDEAVAAAAALAAKEAAEAAAQEKDEKYNTAIAAADAAFDAKEWETAKTKYNEAKTVKPDETYPDEQLKAIDEAIAAAAALAAKEAAEAAAQEKDAKYDAAIAEADKAYKGEDWETAKTKYNEAKSVKPEETYPDEQLKAIEEAIAAAAALAAKEASEAAAKEKEQKYIAAISSADKAFKAEDWETARASYNEAKSVKPEETYPDEQLKAIDEAIAAASALAAKEAAEAAAKAKEEKYQAFIDQADKAFSKKQWQDAKSNYEQASGVKPDETYPKEQIKLVNAELAQAAEEEMKDNYDAYISTADQAFKTKDWSSAKTNYESALSLFPNEQYPKDQLVRIQEALAKENELALQNKQEEDYKQAIGDADQLFNNEQWEASKKRYQAALDIKPTESYPQERIGEINAKLSALADAAQDEAKYAELIAAADTKFDSEDFKSARASYAEALKIKSDPYPKAQIQAIDEKLNADKAAAAAARQAEADKQREYDKFIYDGDKNFKAEKYEVAKSNYQRALSVKPDQSYPKKKIDEIDEIMSNQSAPVAAAPVAKKSSGMSEAEIAAMMAKWQAEREQAKTDRLDQYKKDLKETQEERVENADDRIADANADLDELEASIAESNKAGKDRNLEEAMLVAEFKEDEAKFRDDLNRDAKDKREELYSDIQETEMGQKEMKEEGNELYKVNTEQKATEKMELAQTQKNRSDRAYEGIMVAKEGIQEQEEDWKEFKEGRKDAHMKDVERIQKENELVIASVRTWGDEDKEDRSDAYEDIRKLERDIHEFQVDNAESYMPNTEKYNETVEDLSKYKDQKNSEANERRTKAWNDITDYQEEVGEITEERHNRYDANNEQIRREHQAILDQNAQLSAEADERRMQFDRDFYTGEKQPRYPELAREYKQGVTEESYEEDDAYVIKRIVVEGENMDEYQKIYYKWGGVYYKKNGRNVTEAIWNAETE